MKTAMLKLLSVALLTFAAWICAAGPKPRLSPLTVVNRSPERYSFRLRVGGVRQARHADQFHLVFEGRSRLASALRLAPVPRLAQSPGSPQSYYGRIEIEENIGVVHDNMGYQYEIGCREIYAFDLMKDRANPDFTAGLWLEGVKQAPRFSQPPPTALDAFKLVSGDWREERKTIRKAAAPAFSSPAATTPCPLPSKWCSMRDRAWLSAPRAGTIRIARARHTFASETLSITRIFPTSSLTWRKRRARRSSATRSLRSDGPRGALP